MKPTKQPLYRGFMKLLLYGGFVKRPLCRGFVNLFRSVGIKTGMYMYVKNVLCVGAFYTHTHISFILCTVTSFPSRDLGKQYYYCRPSRGISSSCILSVTNDKKFHVSKLYLQNTIKSWTSLVIHCTCGPCLTATRKRTENLVLRKMTFSTWIIPCIMAREEHGGPGWLMMRAVN